MEPSTIVIKVKYGETLRRFNASIVNEKLVLDMEELRVKVLRLFNFAVDAELTLTYVDEDGDMVTLADEEDLQDVVRQSLNPLRITVRLNTERSGRMYSRSSGSSTPTRSPRVRHPLNASVSDILKSVPGPLREAASTLSKNLSLNSTSSPQALTELVDNLSRMGLTYLKQIAEFQAGTEPSTKSGASGSNLDLSENNDTKGSNVEVDPSPNANSKVRNLKDNQVLPKADLPALNSSELSTGRGVDVSAMLPPGSVDLNINLPNDHFSGMPYLSSDVNVPVGVKNKESKKSNECPLGGMSVGLGASGDSSGSHAGLNRVSKCPYAGTVVANDSAFPFPQLYAPHRAPLSDGAGSIFHRGVQCDGCGALPITGRRFKSKVKDDYDLCSICFAEQGNEADYIRMDRPLTFRKSLSSKGLYDPVQHCRVRPPMLPPHIFRGPGMKGGRHKLDSRFIQDVNILDGTIMGPSTPFTKIWRMKNNGTIVWPRGTHLMWIGGDRFSNNVSVELEIPTDGLPVEEELDIAIDFCAPELPGRYISYWRMALPSGQKFGQRVWVLIQVDASLRDSWHPTTRGFNLNLPPTSGLINGPQIVNVNVEPMVKNSPVEPEDSNRGTELVEPLLDAYPNKDQELNFPINDTLLVGGGASNPSPAEASSSSISYPVVDFSEVEPILHYTEPKPADMNVPAPVPAPAQREGGNNDVEQKLLRELEEMGFKQVDLNKEILRRNEYDLQQSVDDLCSVEEWDPILDDLKEMGFCNDEVNKRLLKKNNGSIKRVVMDLINGEKA